MDVECNESCSIKAEVTVIETFSFCGEYGDCENEDFEEPFKCKEEDNLEEHLDISDNPVAQYTCNECDFRTTQKDYLMEHLKIIKNIQYFCKECNFKTRLECSMNEHLRIHHRADDIGINDESDFKTPQIFSLKRQFETMENGNDYVCNECDFRTTQKDSLIEHLKIIKNVRYFCKECNFKTLLECSMNKHLRIHHRSNETDYKTPQVFSSKGQSEPTENDNDYICNECGFKTTQKDYLIEHLKIIKNIQYCCKECNFKTLLECSMNEHLRIHHKSSDKVLNNQSNFKTPLVFSLKRRSETTKNDNDYICNECDYKTSHKSNLKNHLKSHRDKQYVCKEHCYKTQQKHTRETHIKSHTGGSLKCKQCDYKTLSRSCINGHLKVHMSDEFNSIECDYKTLWERCFNAYVKICTGDELKCKECDYKTVWEHNFNAHMKSHTCDELKCNDCDFKTLWKHRLKVHVKSHMADKFKCNVCDYKTVQKRNLESHIKIHSTVRNVIIKVQKFKG